MFWGAGGSGGDQREWGLVGLFSGCVHTGAVAFVPLACVCATVLPLPTHAFAGLFFVYEGADGIALSHDMQWLHYCPLTSHSFYRIETKLLRDDTVSRGNV